MDPDLIPLLLTLGAALSLGGMALVGVRIWADRIRRSASAQLGDEIYDRLREEIREEITLALERRETELEELHERVDFAERMLSHGRLPREGEERGVT
jgi:hypothetical protein